MIVVDTNIIAHTWLPGEQSDSAKALIRRDNDWIAPILWRSEFRSVLTKYLRAGKLSEGKANELSSFAEDQLAGREFAVPTREVFAVVKNSTLSAYDAEFVALARLRGIKMVTLDKKIAREFPQTAVDLEAFLKSRNGTE